MLNVPFTSIDLFIHPDVVQFPLIFLSLVPEVYLSLFSQGAKSKSPSPLSSSSSAAEEVIACQEVRPSPISREIRPSVVGRATVMTSSSATNANAAAARGPTPGAAVTTNAPTTPQQVYNFFFVMSENRISFFYTSALALPFFVNLFASCA